MWVPNTGVLKNMWRRSPAGLYLPGSRRMNFPLDGLVFYAPLWHPELNVSPFLSKDLNAHSCTVSEATWGIQGRTFDGTDDYINVPDHDVLDATSLTFLIWAKATANAATLTCKGNPAADNWQRLLMLLNTEASRWYVNSSAQLVSLAQLPANMLNNWHFYALSHGSDDAVRFYYDAVLQTDTTSTWSLTANTHPLTIGAKRGTPNARWFAGTMGEVMMYNPALSITEIEQTYRATKWRYA